MMISLVRDYVVVMGWWKSEKIVRRRCYHNRVENGTVDEELSELKVMTTRI